MDNDKSQQADNQTVRGPLRFEVETSSPLIEAGRPFSVFLRITNPFEAPVTIQKVAFLVPVEFRDETALSDVGFGLQWKTEFPSLRAAGPAGRPNKAFQLGVVQARSVTGNLGGSGGPGPAVGLDRAAEAADASNEMVDRSSSLLVQPGNTVAWQVTLRTTRWLFFTPAAYALEAQLTYTLDGQENHDAVKIPLSLKAPLPALITGALLGSLCGSLFKALQVGAPAWKSLVPQVLTSMVLASMVIVAFARKKDAQPFVSVEDFYGGLFIGFLVGLSGQAWLTFLTSGSAPPAVPSPAASGAGVAGAVATAASAAASAASGI
jgi:hypothetical protein